MTDIILRRLASTMLLIVLLSMAVFAFLRLLPGDTTRAILGPRATEEQIAVARTQLGLDQSLPTQYVRYIRDLASGNLGASAIDGAPVARSLADRFLVTLVLTSSGMVIAILAGIPLGNLAARFRSRWPDGAITVGSLLAYSIPVFVFGLLLQYIFAVRLQWLPASGQANPRVNYETITHVALIDSLLALSWKGFADALAHLILPAIAVASGPLAVITRITRASVLETEGLDFVRTARAKGLKRGRIRRRHIMRNAWLPIVTVIGLLTGSLLGGAVITETLFAWNGVGQWMVQSVRDRDYAVVQSLVLVFALVFLFINLLVDISYTLIDPRLRRSA
ncbi:MULTISPECIES: ABC transporter permease [unclassified Mesorhizobium]|uniref:ABC transporter permease n=1 Tax=unclassified Mesorhizobium TaxID=325217 RepID=UPI000FCAB7CD|nr:MULTISPECIES: ABC transporter permease [unclassified Mesorhizobium]RUX91557.1 ABC transporter permease [Mesorhizobium sp. M7D.F.Ca.US.004.01.2.1]RVA18228.1 ABC transporter permease [Mesorhizobium sp. M7D.F.Ca.US.004.03.1.1]